MKSTAIWAQRRLRMGKGGSRPAGGSWEALPLVHTEQASTNSQVFLAILGHQKCWRRNSRVSVTQGGRSD